jgi:hypothetical protein
MRGKRESLAIFIHDGLNIEVIGPTCLAESPIRLSMHRPDTYDGMSDDQINFRQPGLPDETAIRSEIRAVIAG